MNPAKNLENQLKRIKRRERIDFRCQQEIAKTYKLMLSHVRKHNIDNPYYKQFRPQLSSIDFQLTEQFDKERYNGAKCSPEFSAIGFSFEKENTFKYQGSIFFESFDLIKEIKFVMVGVYMLYDADDVLLYVGQSTDIKSRLFQHKTNYNISRIGVLLCDEKYRKALESWVISTFLPVHNSETSCFYTKD